MKDILLFSSFVMTVYWYFNIYNTNRCLTVEYYS